MIGLINSPEEFEAKLREAQAKELENMQARHNQLEHIPALIEEKEREADEIAGALTKTRGLVATRLEQQAEEVDRRYQALLARQAELQETLALQLTDQSIEDLLLFRERVAAGLSNPTFDDKRRWLEILQTEVTVKNRQAIITCRLSTEPVAFSLDSSTRLARQGKKDEFEFSIC